MQKVNRDKELENLHWRIQAIAYGQDFNAEPNGLSCGPSATADAADNPPPSPEDNTPKTAQLRVPTSRKAHSWWSPDFWSIARPTDFCYGDCVWGFFGFQPVTLQIYEWINMLWRREEAEYDVEEGENYEAAAINRFRTSWYDLHLFTSFWRVTETSSSVHTFLKTPGAYGYTSKCAEISPEILEQAILRREQASKDKTSLASLMADKDIPSQLRTALSSLHQATASLVGSDGHRKMLQREGVAYTLRYGPALIFVTPNLADNKQPLLLIVQGERFDFDTDVENNYREMAQRLAADPVGQAIVFEEMMQLFFTRILGIRPELNGWRRGSITKPSNL